MTASCDDNSCLELDACGECGGNGVSGCTNPVACNFLPTATCDDSSCTLPDGCTDETACNFDASATCDDNSCYFSVNLSDTITADSIAFIAGVVVGNDTLFAPGTVVDTIDVASGCDSIIEYVVVELGLTEFYDQGSILLYPNPTNTYFQLNLGKLESKRIEIYDISSRKIFDRSQIQRGVISFDVNDYAPGYYFMRIHSDNRVILQRFEVVR